MNEEFEVLKIVTQRLNKADIPYMVSGSIAANYYTVPRMTRDIDIVIELRNADIDKFVNLFHNDFAEDLILAKLLWAKDSHSEMQLKDVRNLTETVKDINRSYIEGWIEKLHLIRIYKEAKNE